MGNNQSELEFENKRLGQIIFLAKNQLDQAKLRNGDNSLSIISLKQEMREGTSHSISGLWNTQNFDDLIELSQFANLITDKIDDYDRTVNKIAILERVINSPYFARIDFRFDGEEVPEKIYIGRHSLTDDNSYDIVVYDWRSPIASVFYRFGMGVAFYDAPNGRITGEVDLKRQYEIKKGILEYFFDADVQIMDEFLRKMLSQNSSAKMKTIVETIQREQDAVIRDMENDLMMVQGAAGSGKTSIALHRAAYLMYQGLSSKLAADNIIIISPNTIFEQYISNVLPELGEDNVISVVFEEMLATILQNRRIQSRNKFLEKLITDYQHREIMKKSIEFKTSHKFIKILNRFIDDLPCKWIDFGDICYNGECIISGEILKDKISTGRKSTPLGLRLKQMEDFILESAKEFHKQYDNKSEYLKIKKEARKLTEINVEYLYGKLINDEKYFYNLADDMEFPDYVSDILKFTWENLSSGNLYYDDAAVLAFLKLKLNGVDSYKNIKQVVIDEAQDYYIIHYEIFNLLFPNAKYTILGDINQTLEKHENLSLYEQIDKVLNKKKSILVTLDKSFRCTNEILAYSLRFVERAGEIESFNRKGEEPKIYVADEQSFFNDMIISEVEACLEKGYKTIGLICKTEKNARYLFRCLKDKIDVRLIKNDSTADLYGTFIIPLYMSKGLEFDAVLVCDADIENYHSKDDKKLLYIACTRALHRLSFFCNGKISPLL